MKLRDPSTWLIVGATGLSLLVGRDFFFGMLVFMVNYLTFKVIVKMMFPTKHQSKPFKKYVFVPAIVLKFAVIGITTYIVLVTLQGSPVLYVSGFGAGLGCFTVAVVGEHYFGRAARRKS